MLPFLRFSPFLLHSFLLAERGKACRILLLVLASLIRQKGIEPKGITRAVCAIRVTRAFGELKFDESVANREMYSSYPLFLPPQHLVALMRQTVRMQVNYLLCGWRAVINYLLRLHSTSTSDAR